MERIPERIVEKTRQEVAGFSPDRTKKEMMKIGNNQPELLPFVTESTKEMGQEVRELAIYLFLVVYRMFQQAHGKIKDRHCWPAAELNDKRGTMDFRRDR
jgi:hypothetical protein